MRKLFVLIIAGIACLICYIILTSPQHRTTETQLGPTSTLPSKIEIPGANVTMDMVLIMGGSFEMGSPAGDAGRNDNEGPVHTVKVSPFWMGKYEVTVAQFRAFVDDTGYKTDSERGTGGIVGAPVFGHGEPVVNSDASWRKPYFPQSDNHPVVNVSWNDAQEFIKWLNGKVKGGGFRLPSEAEWEYACRAGTKTVAPWGEKADDRCMYANTVDQSRKREHGVTEGDCDDGYVNTSPVGNYRPNEWGLYDMIGNVQEWCQDWYHDSYTGAPSDGSVWESPATSLRVLRGGSWNTGAWRSSSRAWLPPHARLGDIGFRLSRTP